MLYLASASPRRRELLDLAGIPYTTAPANADERFADGTPPEEAVRLLARRKAEALRESGTKHLNDATMKMSTIAA